MSMNRSWRLAALLTPRRVIADEEAIRAQHRQACAIEPNDPIAASQLCDEASRFGRR